MNKYEDMTLSNLMQVTSALSWIVLLVGLYLQNIPLLMISISFIFINTFTKWYLKKVTTSVHVKNNQTVLKLFQGESSELSFSISNTGKLPIWNGKLSFSLDSIAVAETDIRFEESSHLNVNTYSIRLSLPRGANKTLTVPIHARHRGTMKVSRVELVVEDLFGFGSTSCELTDYRASEVLIYPQLNRVKEGQQPSITAAGTSTVVHSLYENLSAPSGAREYVSSDSFNRIHWKASAKTSELKTKLYEPSIEMKWVFILDVSVKRYGVPAQVSQHLEEYISQLAFLCEKATKLGYAFEIHINVDPGGSSPYMMLRSGEGRVHLSKALELLSRIDSSKPIVSHFRMVGMLKQNLYSRESLIVRVGETSMSHAESSLFNELEKRGSKCFEVVTSEHGAFLRKLVKGEVI
ncbi:DUF58 domain-containing protein [Guptibacillus algicola]|uniref:DUF58 domain-containing protein n=1 Tax=Guptibacillus algicola TaxID=225844 RepID=UPI001CD6569A|nr:DUF58 domain-containing protein [Alkalihalobacillus algicola]MCA0985940.1 DUF58 domain-containing protein [Alkalihalobacillus algicola]